MSDLIISNKTARRLWLRANLLHVAPTGPLDLLQIIKGLGFVQLDTIRVIARAHDHILWSRNQNYRPKMLDDLLAKDRQVFEHFTHDASILPMEFLPYWKRQFERKKDRILNSDYFQNMCGDIDREAIKKRIAKEGPLSTHAFDTKIEGEKQPWARPPHKIALDYMWNAGELATSHRENFTKFYDLCHNVFPDAFHTKSIPDADRINWLCAAALNRLGMASFSEIQKFWAATSPAEVKDWAAKNADTFVTVNIQNWDRSLSPAIAPLDIEDQIANLEKPTSRLRILNPFDPAIRDRDRLLRLFGMDYKIEIFVPQAKRKWGYYVYPLLEGDRFVGRIEAKSDRKTGQLDVINFWPSSDTKWTYARHQKLQSELTRIARFAGTPTLVWHCAKPH